MKRLLGLLLVMGMVGCGGSNEGETASSNQPPAQAPDADPVAALEKLDAQIFRNEQGQVIHVRLGRSQVTDAGLVHLKGMTNLEELWLPTQVTAAGLVHLRGLTSLQTLILGETKVTDAGLVHLKRMNLKMLDIPTEAKTDIGLKHYLAAKQPPTQLFLFGWQITDAGLAHIKGMTSLRKLYLTDTKVTDAGIAELQKTLPNCRIIK